MGRSREEASVAMKRLVLCILLASSASWGQSEFTIPLAKTNTALALPSITAGDGMLYVAYRSFDPLRFSKELQVLAWDLRRREEVKHVALPVPKVHGSRAGDGFFLSDDGRTLAYAELHDPGLIVLLGADSLKEINRTSALLFTAHDHQRMFAGFDQNQLCLTSDAYDLGRPTWGGLRFIRLGTTDLRPVSDNTASGLRLLNQQAIVWLPRQQRTWIWSLPGLGSDLWTEYTEGGEKTGQALEGHEPHILNGAIALGEGRLLAFYGNMISKGAVVSYADHHSETLKLDCVPDKYGRSNDGLYAGALCMTSVDRELEHGGGKVLSSEFLLLDPAGPTIIWRHAMRFRAVANRGDLDPDSGLPDSGVQRGEPLIYRFGSQIYVIAPSKAPKLTVYEVPPRK